MLECKQKFQPGESDLVANFSSYNGTSDLQLERMNVYFNEVSRPHDIHWQMLIMKGLRKQVCPTRGSC